jgi:hypothetical protein
MLLTVSISLYRKDIIKRELANLEAPAFYLFAKNIPYADVDLSPPLGFDPEKARLLLDMANWTGSPVRSKAGQQLVREISGNAIMLCICCPDKPGSHQSLMISHVSATQTHT